MQTDRASITALITAYARAYHAAHDSPKIFDDFLVDRFFSPEEHASFDQNLAQTLMLVDPDLALTSPDQATALARVIQVHNGPVTLSRSRFTEDSLEEAVRQGVQQYVILGAGFDTFAFRRSDLLERLRVFEVDHPATQAEKRRRIEKAEWRIPKQLHFIAVDFNKENLTEALSNSMYDPERPSFFSWQGVTYYLAREVVLTTLREIARMAGKNNLIVFDYIDADAFHPEKAGRRIRLMQEIAKMVGESMQTGFTQELLSVELADTGWQLLENLAPSEIEAGYFQNRSDQYHAFEHFHFAKAKI